MSNVISNAATVARKKAARPVVVYTTLEPRPLPPSPPPPQVEDVPDDEDGKHTPDPGLSSTSSETSFESDTDDKPLVKAPKTPPSPATSHSSARLTIPDTQPRHDMSGVTPCLMDELRNMIKQEITDHLKLMDTAPSPRITPTSLMNSMFGTAYPSPPPSVAAASKLSSPPSTSPRLAVAVAVPERATVRFRNRGSPVIHAHPRSDVLPGSPGILGTESIGASSGEKAWGRLFDAEGNPTQRLGHALRSLAYHVITEFGIPGIDLVTPDKMQAFYTKYRVEDEEFPLQDVFKPCKDKTYERTEYLYQDLDCTYHLAQAVAKSRPSIPGLAIAGFVKWLTTNILAYPEQEARRFALLLPDLPPMTVPGPDGAQERLPRILPRALLPATHNKKMRRLLDEALLDCLEDHDVSSLLPGFRGCENAHAGPGQGHFLTRANSETSGITMAQRGLAALPPPPVGRYNARGRSPTGVNRCSASAPNMGRAAEGMKLLRPRTGGVGSNEKERDRDRAQEREREHAERRKSLVIGGPTWGDYYKNGSGRREEGHRGR